MTAQAIHSQPKCHCWHCTRISEVVNVCDCLRSDLLLSIEDRRTLSQENERLKANALERPWKWVAGVACLVCFVTGIAARIWLEGR